MQLLAIGALAACMPEHQTILERFAYRVNEWAGSSWAFIIAVALTLLWLVSGPVFEFSDTWQLVMNTVSSVSTFIMVFLIQRSQNKDALAMQIKLNEIIAALQGANNQLINIEDLSEEEMLALRKRYQVLANKFQRSPEASTESVSTVKTTVLKRQSTQQRKE